MTAPKTFLQLCKELRREVGANGTGPASVLSQTGEYERIVEWIRRADAEIQQENDNWRFMIGTFAIDTVAGTASYGPAQCSPALTNFRIWRDRSIKCYLLASGQGSEHPLYYMDYDDFDTMYNLGNQTPGQPLHFTFAHDMSLLLGPTPSDVYRVRGEYSKSAVEMTADSDTPIYPAEYHMLPVYLAMFKYAGFTAASEVYATGLRLYKQLLSRMERTQLPRINRFTPLA